MARTARGRLFLELYAQAIVLGLCTGAFVSLLHLAIDTALVWHQRLAGGAGGTSVAGMIACAAVGAGLVCLARALCLRFAPEATGSGIQEVEGAVTGHRTLAWRRVIPVKFVGGVFAIGSGLSLGREGPSIHIGACLARMLAEQRPLGFAGIQALIAGGAGAGLAAAFNAPLAGILFVGEELRRGLPHSATATHVVILTSSIATLVGWGIVGHGPMMPVPDFAWPQPLAWPLFAVAGALTGAFGVLFNRSLLLALDVFDRLGRGVGFLAAATVGAASGLFIAVDPDLVGEGAALSARLITETPALPVLVILLVARTTLFFISYPLAVPGGLFAPMLALGAIIGLSLGGIADAVSPAIGGNSGPLAIAAMAALVTATVRAPLTAVALVTELTGTFTLLPAMIIAGSSASMTAQMLGGRPIYEQLLARTLRKARQSPVETSVPQT
ncbi:MAG: H(+)/Cl(-) exchange transporter ClcA [Rhodospirillales bacterium]